jgi:uncharacterized LabA/DUF88 family protein
MLQQKQKKVTSFKMLNNYFFIDGSALMAQVRQLWRGMPLYDKKRLCLNEFIKYQIGALGELHGRVYKRATFYFARGDDNNISEFLILPEYKIPGLKKDLHFKYCGSKLKKSAEFDRFVQDSVPEKFQNRFSKSEKGVDIEMCCDALRLASANRIDRLFILTNDSDFVPLCRTIKEFGSNISMLYLSRFTPPNSELLEETDTYDTVPDDRLSSMFFDRPASVSNGKPSPLDVGVKSNIVGLHISEPEKPDAFPSDLDHAVRSNPIDD